MRLTSTVTYPADVDRVLAMLQDPEYTRTARVEAAAARAGEAARIALDVESAEEDGRTGVRVHAPVPADALPAAARSIAPASLAVTAFDLWEAAGRAPGAPVEGVLRAEVRGVPATLHATQHLVPVSGGTERRVEGELKVAIPFLGAAIERAAAAQVQQVLDAEESAAAHWLARP